MTWELFLYPEVQEIGWHIWWWWTRVWGLLMLWVLRWLFGRHSESGWEEIFETIVDESPIIDTSLWQTKISSLQERVGTASTQSRYRDYQQLLREIIQWTYGIDISSMTLQSLKYSYTWLQKSLVNLLEQSYYYPYNLESGDKWVMQDEIEKLYQLTEDATPWESK